MLPSQFSMSVAMNGTTKRTTTSAPATFWQFPMSVSVDGITEVADNDYDFQF